jgi:hypothetical protein
MRGKWFNQFLWESAPMGEVWVRMDFVKTIQLRLRLNPPLRSKRNEDAASDLRDRLLADWRLTPLTSLCVSSKCATHG